jgi:FkbM family methyltransferase
VRAAQAIRRLNPLPFKIIAVEGEPTHYEFLKRNFHDNGINPSDCSLMKVAVWNKKGTVKFHTGNPTGWYGQCIMKQPLFSTIKSTLLYLLGAYNPNDKSGITVPTITLDEILSLLHHVDLIDIDIQGTELDVISHSIEIINEKVMRIHIGTHSSEIEERLRDIFLKNNWRKHFYYQLQSTIETPYGKIKFDDGVQSWINPRLVV